MIERVQKRKVKMGSLSDIAPDSSGSKNMTLTDFTQWGKLTKRPALNCYFRLHFWQTLKSAPEPQPNWAVRAAPRPPQAPGEAAGSDRRGDSAPAHPWATRPLGSLLSRVGGVWATLPSHQCLTWGRRGGADAAGHRHADSPQPRHGPDYPLPTRLQPTRLHCPGRPHGTRKANSP